MDDDQSPKEITTSKTVILPTIFILTIGTLLYINYKWKRRRIDEIMNSIKKPPGLPVIGNALLMMGSAKNVLQSLVHTIFKYGPNFAMWLGNVPVIVVGKPEDLETVLQSRNCLGKVHVWRKTRKIIQPTFHAKIVNNFLPIFVSTNSICVNEVLPNYEGKNDVEWNDVLLSTTLDTLSQTAFGIKKAHKSRVEYARFLDRALHAVIVRMTNVFIHPDFIFKLTKLSKELNESVKYARTFISEILSEKKAKFLKKMEQKNNEASVEDGPMENMAFLDRLLELSYKEQRFTDEEIKNEILTILLGGTDTLTCTIGFFLSMIGMHQHIQHELYEEIITVLGPDKTPELEDLLQLDLLERSLKESMRLFPPGHLITRQVTEKEVILSDCTLPVGAVLLLSFFYTHRCVDYWNDPLKFDPDRFLPEEVAKRHIYTYLPFSRGLRNCIGVKYAMMNMKVLLSMLLRKYKIYCNYSSIEEIEFDFSLILKPVHGFGVRIEARE